MLSTGFEGIDDWQGGGGLARRKVVLYGADIDLGRLDDTREGLMSSSDIEHKLRTDLVTRV